MMNVPFNKILQYAERGSNDKLWYAQTKATIQQALPWEDINIVIDLIAATSIHSTLKSNVSQFFKALHQLRNNLPFTGYMPNVIHQLELARDEQPLSGRKVNAFAKAIKGDPEAVVVDIWILRAFIQESRERGRETPSRKEYDFIESWFRTEAAKWNLEPRQMCSMVWSGIRNEQGYFRETTRYCDVIKSKITPGLFVNGEGAIYYPSGIRINPEFLHSFTT